MHPELPTGTVTFLFTDIEGSTRLLQDEYSDVLAEHHRLLRAAWRQHEGVEVGTQGDAFFVAAGLHLVHPRVVGLHDPRLALGWLRRIGPAPYLTVAPPPYLAAPTALG